jgi:MYXO-CTERM domain-containing protein
MTKNDVRRLSGHARLVKRALCNIAIGLGILLAFPTEALATRGRVKVANNTIVTDTGSLIRGARVSLDIWDETPSQADIDAIKNTRGLNAVHIYAEYPGSNKAAGYNVAKVDKVVDMADQNDLYVVLTIGSGGGNGSFNGAFVTAFWAFYAPHYKDRTHVVFEVCNEPQAWSAPYNTNTLTMEKNAYTQIRGLAPDTHIMMMSYSQPNNWAQAATECAGLGVDWSNASVAFHTYGIDGKEDSTLTSFYKALQAKGIGYACTEPNLTLKAITAKLFERDGVSETQFISAHDIASNASAFSSWITSNNICWTPDFGTWPACSGTVVPARGGASGAGGRTGTGGISGSGDAGPSSGTGGMGGPSDAGPSSGTGGHGDTGGSTSTASGSGGASGVGGAAAVGGANGSGGALGSGGQQGVGGVKSSGGATSGSGGASAAPSGGEAGGNSTSNGCSCTVGKGRGTHGPSRDGGIALVLGLVAFAFIRRRP